MPENTDNMDQNTNNDNQNESTNLLKNGSASDTNESSSFSVPSKFMEDGMPNYEKLVQSYVNMEKKMGKKVAPDSYDEYAYEFKNKDIWNEDGVAEFKKYAHSLGMSQEQYEGILKFHEQSMESVLAPYTVEAVEASLKEEWGDDFKANLNDAYKAWQTYSDESMDINEIGNNPVLIKFLSNIGKELKEDKTPNNVGVASGLTRTEVDELMSSPDYWTNKEKQAVVGRYFEQQQRK